MGKLTKYERIMLDKQRAGSYFDQGRRPEGRALLERIIDDLLKPLAPKAKK